VRLSLGFSEVLTDKATQSPGDDTGVALYVQPIAVLMKRRDRNIEMQSMARGAQLADRHCGS
jgi:hypothetical protein